VVLVGSQRKELEAHRVIAPGGQRLTAYLDAAPEDADEIVADVTAGIRRVDDDAVAAS